MEVNFDTKDKRILAALDKDATLPLRALAKQTGLSSQVALYRLNRLIEQKTIYGFFGMPDLGKLGYSLFRMHIRLKDAQEPTINNFSKYLFEEYPTYWIGLVLGPFDMVVDIFAKTPDEFEGYVNKILASHKTLIASYEILIMLELNIYSYGYFLNPVFERNKTTLYRQITNPTKLDKIDVKILHAISKNARITNQQLGESCDLTRNAAKSHLLALRKEKILEGKIAMVDFRQFNRVSYKIFVRYDTTWAQEEQKLIAFLDSTPGIISIAKYLGAWNLDIEIQVPNAKELQKFIISLRTKFHILGEYSIVQLLEDYQIDFFPKHILKELTK